MKENQIRELVNELRDIAVEYHGTQQLRERIARTVRAAIIQAGNSPVIGIDMASEPDRSVEVRYLAPPGYVMVPKVVTPEISNAINEVGQRCTCGNCSQRLWDYCSQQHQNHKMRHKIFRKIFLLENQR